ncbi:MAG: hypothetical protein R3E66_00735 [bacterium]
MKPFLIVVIITRNNGSKYNRAAIPERLCHLYRAGRELYRELTAADGLQTFSIGLFKNPLGTDGSRRAIGGFRTRNVGWKACASCGFAFV